jgi:tocopherol cyclase
MTGNHRQYSSMHFQNLARKEYFEGWYYKQVTPDERTVISFIPGLSVRGGKASPFIQVNLAQKTGDTWHQTTDWLDYTALRAQDEPFFIQLGDNSFRREGVIIAYQGARLQVTGELIFHNIIALPRSGWAPTIMGPFSYLPGMECIHSVISLSHTIAGSLTINDKLVDFTQGKGYIEKDWGSSFPKRYVWLQSNHFAQEGSLFFSWADIPALGMYFRGYIAHLYYQGEHHRFATYTRGRCKLKAGGHMVEIALTNGDSELQIKASQSPGGELIAPHRGAMVHTIKEGLFGQVAFSLKRNNSSQVLRDQTDLAGVELVWAKGEKQG